LSDFVVEGGFDDRAILEGFKKLVTTGEEAGRKVGAGFQDQLNRFGKRSIAALQEDLGRLQSRQLKLNVDSAAFAKTGERIKEIERLIDLANKKRLSLNFDPSSLTALRARLQEINQQLERVAVGSKAFKTLQRQAREAADAIERANGASKGIGIGLDAILPAAGALGILLAVGRALTFIATESTKLESASAAVRTLGADSAELEARLLAVSRATGSAISQSELVRAAYDVISSGFSDAADAAAILEAANLGAVGGFSDIDTVANATTSVLNAYGLSADKSAELVDGFIQTQNDGKIVVAEYAQQIGKVAPIAASAGVSLKELNAAIAVATVSGVRPEAAITGLRQAIAAIIKPSEKAEALATKLGIGFSAQALKAKGLEGVLADVAAATKGASGLNLELFGSVEALTAIQPSLVANTERFTKALENQNKAAGVAKKATEEVADTVEGATKRIQGAIANLASSIGGSILKDLKPAMNFLSKSIEDIQTVNQAADLQNLFGFSTQEALQLAGTLSTVQERYKLSADEAKNLLSNAIANSGAAKDWFGNLRAGGENFGRVQEGLIDQAIEWSNRRTAGAQAAAGAEGEITLSLEDQVKILRQIGASREALTKVEQQVPLGKLAAQLQGAQSLITFAGALADLEESRFATVRARNQYEIDNAAKLGISQQGIAEREAANMELQKQGLIARYQATLQLQKVEQVTLGLKQRQAEIEAQLLVLDQERNVAKAKQALASADASQDAQRIADAQNLLEQERIGLGLAQQKLGIIKQIAPIERQIAGASAEITQQQLLQQGASLGIEGQLRSMTPEVKAQNNAWRESVQATTQIVGGIDTIRGGIGAAAKETESLGRGFIQVGNRIVTFGSSGIDETTGDAARSADDLAGGIGTAADQAGTLAGNMNDAASSAEKLYRFVNSASGIAPARFTGGPVEAGGRYRINDGPGGRPLGQESFLSRSGDLSLIRQPANSMWTAPAPGIVLPAAVTDTLKARGAFAAGGGGARRAAAAAGGIRPGGAANTARLELAITHLTAKVDALARKDWNVTARVRTSNAGGQLRILNASL
jgi:TP901 family phage tail tape measure protein